MPEMRNCIRCKRIFLRSTSPVCPACVQKEEDDFILVRDYIREHPHCGLQKVEEETGVTMEMLLKFLREDRLQLSSESGMKGALKCQKCGEAIDVGKYCDRCTNELSAGLTEALSKIGKEDYGSGGNDEKNWKKLTPKKKI
jgi:flagellar operon protein (TIGR03826 family)